MGGRRPRETGKYCTTQFFRGKVIVRPVCGVVKQALTGVVAFVARKDSGTYYYQTDRNEIWVSFLAVLLSVREELGNSFPLP